MKTALFQSCGHCWVFQICWHIECSTLTALSFRILNSSSEISSPLLALFIASAAATAKSLQSCLTLCDSIDGSPPGSTVPGILQARTLEWVAISFSNAWKWKVKVKSLSRVRPSRPHRLQPTRLLCPWDLEYWSGLPLPSLILFSRITQLKTEYCHMVVLFSLFQTLPHVHLLIFSLVWYRLSVILGCAV